MTDDTLKLWQVIVYGIEHTIDEETLKAWILAGKIRQEDRVKKAGTNWTEARNVPKLRDLFAQAASLRTSNPPSSERTETPNNSTTIRPGTFPKQPPHQFIPSPGAWKKGDILVVEDEYKLPHRCLKCNSEKDVVRMKQLFRKYNSLLLIISGAISPLVLLLVLWLSGKRRHMDIWLCKSHFQNRVASRLLRWLLVIPLFLIMFEARRQNSIFLILFGIYGFIICILILYYIGQTVSVEEIEDPVIYLKNVPSEYLKHLPDWPPVV